MIDAAGKEMNGGSLTLLGTVPVGEELVPLLYTVGGEEIVVTRHEGMWRGFVNRCPHAGSPLADGVTTDDATGEGRVFCGRHGWEFDLVTGERTGNWSGSGRFTLILRMIVEEGGMLYLRGEECESGGIKAETMGRTYLVRYGVPGWVSKFRGGEGEVWPSRARVLVRTERGVEEGEVLGTNVKEKISESMGEVLRGLGEDEERQRGALKERAEKVLESAQRLGARGGYAQQFVDAESLWDGETVVVYFLGKHGLELADLMEEIGKEEEIGIGVRVQFQPLIEMEEASGGGCGSGGCGCGS